MTAGGGTRPTVTATATSTADLGVAVSEYSGLLAVANATVVDQGAHTTGKTTAAQAVSSGPTAAATAANDLAIGFYVDSGFGATLERWARIHPTLEHLGNGRRRVADRRRRRRRRRHAGRQHQHREPTPCGWQPPSCCGQRSEGDRPCCSRPPSRPCRAGPRPALTWNAPYDGGSPITSYTVTPYVGTVAQTPTTVTGTPPPASATVTGLTNGTSYTFVVAATNSTGTGPASDPIERGGARRTCRSASGLPCRRCPIEALSNILMKNGSFLSWDGWQQPQPSVIWNPATPGVYQTDQRA